MRVATCILITVIVSFGAAQSLPDGATTVTFECPPPENVIEPRNEDERLEFERRRRYRAVFPAYLAAVGKEHEDELPMPVDGVRVAQVSDTWGAPRGGGRSHEGQDIFAPHGTEIRSVTPGYVYRMGESRLGGKVVVVVGGGGRRYYYAHLSDFAEVREGQRVETGDLLGFVGSSGNAVGTPPHLHFGVYVGDDNPCAWNAINPLPLMVDR
jgi:murein DD-endopeptidase MepM/ murein hydrolase activator NlpD